MSERPWYRRFPDNFIAGTVGLSLEEKGAYGLVIDLIYVRGGPVPDEPRYIAGVCNCSVRKWNAIRARLINLGKLEMVNGCLMNPRAEEELQIAARSAQERAENGAKGGNKSAETRADRSKNNDLAQAPLKPARPSPLPELIKKEEGAIASGPTDEPVKLNRYVETELFAACEALTEKVPGFQTAKSWPPDIVRQAAANLEQARAEVMH